MKITENRNQVLGFYGLIFIFCCVIYSCNNQEDKRVKHEDLFISQGAILDSINNSHLQFFEEQIETGYKNNTYYEELRDFHKLCDSLLSKVSKENKKVIFKKIEGFIYNKLPEDKNIKLYFDNIKYSSNSNYFRFQIRVLENLVGNFIKDRYNDRIFKIDRVQPLVISKKDTIKLGEKYSAQIYLSGIDSNNKFIAIVDGDTLNYGKYGIVPVYRFTPKKKGLYSKKGDFLIYKPNSRGNYTKMEFELIFFVQ